MPDCVAFFRYQTGSGIVVFFSARYRTDRMNRHSGSQNCGAIYIILIPLQQNEAALATGEIDFRVKKICEKFSALC
jgi:hypothetical protein